MKYPLAIMDYGIGGIDLLSRVKSAFPELPLLYFSDSGAIPYGRLSHSVLKSRVNSVIDHLFSLGAHKIVVACHSASSVIENQPDVLPIRELTVQSVLASSVKKVGVIGGGRTIRSGFYRKALEAGGMKVKQRIAQEFSILVERGELDTDYARNVAQSILKPLRNMDGVLLACTHYTVLQPLIKTVLGDRVLILDPISTVFNHLSENKWLQNGTTGEKMDRILTTGDPSLMQQAAFSAFGYTFKGVEVIRI